MFLKDLTIPEAEVVYQKAAIRGAWWFLAIMIACAVAYCIAQKIVQDRMDARYHARQLARIKATGEIGQTGFYKAAAHSGQIIRELKKEIEQKDGIIRKKDKHIERLEETMDNLHFGDVADRIRKEMEQ